MTLANSPGAVGFVTMPMKDGSNQAVRFDVLVAATAVPASLDTRENLNNAIEMVAAGSDSLYTLTSHTQIDTQLLIQTLADIRYHMQRVMNLKGISEQALLNHCGSKYSERYKELFE